LLDYLLYRRENGNRVWLYERVQRHELNARLRKGWKISGWLQSAIGGVILIDRLPDKLVSLDQVRINRGLEKICQCQKRKGLREMRGCG